MTRPARARRRRVPAPAHLARRENPRGRPYEPQTRLVMDPARDPTLRDETLRGPARDAAVCASKQPYLSEALAGNAAVLIGLASGRPPATPYACPVCPDWHLTSS